MRQSVPAQIGIALAALCALGGLAICVVLLQHHIVVEIGGDPILGGLCEDVGGKSSCDEALQSRWGKVVLGKDDNKTVIPTSMFGFVFFACMASWFIIVGRPSGSRRGLHVLPVIGVAVGAVICAILDAIMWIKLEAPCWLCFYTHVLTWVLLLLTLILWPRAGSAAGPVVVPASGSIETSRKAGQACAAHPPMHLLLAALFLAVATSAAGWGIYQWKLKTAYANEYFARWQRYDKDYAASFAQFMKQPQYDIPILPEDPVRGPADAPHTVVVFTDFQCPFCKALASHLDDQMAEFPGKFRIVFKYFPMNVKCNDYVKSTLHGASCAAAVTAEAARLLGGPEAFWKMHDELFRDPEGFAKNSTDYVKQACEKLKLDHDELWKKINSYGVWDHIRVNGGQGSALDVKATPILFFDGRRMVGWGDRHNWRFLVESPPPAATRPATTTRPVVSAPAMSAPATAPAVTTSPR